MLSVKDAAELLGISDSRVRKLIADGLLPARKVGRAWVLEEVAVLTRLTEHPKAGRPSAGSSQIMNVAQNKREQANQAKKRRRLYQDCKAFLSTIPDASVMAGAESAEEASFYVAIADFFLQQKQRELIERGVY